MKKLIAFSIFSVLSNICIALETNTIVHFKGKVEYVGGSNIVLYGRYITMPIMYQKLIEDKEKLDWRHKDYNRDWDLIRAKIDNLERDGMIIIRKTDHSKIQKLTKDDKIWIFIKYIDDFRLEFINGTFRMIKRFEYVPITEVDNETRYHYEEL